MKNTRLLIILILSIFLISAANPPPADFAFRTPANMGGAGAAQVKLEINNKSGSPLTVTLSGPGAYTVAAQVGKTRVEVLKGSYRYAYSACGAYQTGDIVVKKTGDQLLIPACSSGKSTSADKSQKPVKFVVLNKSGTTVTVSLWGPAPYTVNAKTGKTKLELPKGKYQYSYRTDCAGYANGSVEVKKSGDQLLIPGCGTVKVKADQKIKTIKPTVKNDTGGVLLLYLSGPANYSFTIAPGKSKIEVIKGEYNYTAYGCGTTKSGSLKIGPNLIWTWFCTP